MLSLNPARDFYTQMIKKSESGVIIDPIFIKPNATIREALELMSEYRISGVPVVDDDNVLIGILPSMPSGTNLS